MTPEEQKLFDLRWKSEFDLKLDKANSRITVIERLVWTATGGVVVLAAASAIGVSVLREFNSKIEAMSNDLAVVMAEYRVRQGDVQRELERLRNERRR